MRIKYIIPFPFDDAGVKARAAQVPDDLLGPGVTIDFVPVRNSCFLLDSYYESILFDAYVAEAGLQAEDEGYDAVVMDTVSDSGLQILRSRLTIPVIGPGQVAFHLAGLLGQKFSVITMWDTWRFFYRKLFKEYGLTENVASIRAVNIPPDVEALFAGKEEEMYEKLAAEAMKAIESDGADVIVIGSTTMHQAASYLTEHLPVPVINPGPAAVAFAETIVRLGLSHSKVAYPSPGTIQDEKFFSMIGADGGTRTAAG
ncbi:hydrogenase expression protein HupH [Baekduia soli]|uniref:Hydrogenase expression protein HupH n=1 Tax=Baekduia soli TaxID=496014 RepID=A0A5B8U5N7_9ACTN|nr:aspartate/glutamate racemase family protein [Baekduia soli]QEC48404.1 hydrogenase expression protein HupH [Baekduia soli]